MAHHTLTACMIVLLCVPLHGCQQASPHLFWPLQAADTTALSPTLSIGSSQHLPEAQLVVAGTTLVQARYKHQAAQYKLTSAVLLVH